MTIGQSDASKPKVFVGHSNESPHDNRATARAAKYREMANKTTSAPCVSKKQSKGQVSQQPYEFLGPVDDVKDARGHPAQVLDPQRDAFQARYHNGPPSPDRTEFCDRQYLVSRLHLPRETQREMTDVKCSTKGESLQQTASSAKGEYLEGLRKVESNPALVPKSKDQEQPSEEEYQNELALSGDKVKQKPLNSKRRAEDTKVPHKKSRTSMATDTNKRLETFACPYYRKHPERYLDCINLKMIRISDVKQHLKRRHTFNYSCTRCFEGFSSSKTYEDHVLKQSCPITDCNNNDGVSPDAQEALKYRVDRSSSSERQWHEICRILFGTLGLSLSPYQDGVFKEITGIIRGIWRNEEQSIISSLKETQNVPCADQLRPLLSEILTKVEDCFEQKEKKPLKGSPYERSKSIEDTPRKSPEEGKLEYDCKPSGLSTVKNNNEQLEINEPYNPPMQDWSYSAGLDSSSNFFNYTVLPEYQNQQVGCPFMNLSAGLLHPDDGRNWHFTGPNSITAMENIVAQQVSMENSTFPEDDLLSAQMPNMFD